jgi:hypothetical protein
LLLFEFAFAGGEGLFALAEFFDLGGGGVVLLAFEFEAVLIDLHPLAFNGVAFGGEFLVRDLLFEFLLSRDGIGGFSFQFGDLFGDLG